MKYYYEDNFMIFKLEGILHKKIILYKCNYTKHIKIKHPEINIKKIEEILNQPDYIYKSSKNSKTYYYEKNFDDDTYRVVIKKQKKHVKCVITAYKVENKKKFTPKHVYCIYNKETFISYEDIEKELEDDINYFYEIFNVAK